jgi:hypothetical protein
MNLKEARKQGKLDQFIKEREKDAHGDDERLAKTIFSMSVGSLKEEQETSSQGSSDD